MAIVPLYDDYLNKMGCAKKSDAELAEKVAELEKQAAESEKKLTELEQKANEAAEKAESAEEKSEEVLIALNKLNENLIQIGELGGENSFKAINQGYEP
ncbi:hypothetical protein A1D22_05835 [Pasteurellaceae bacterium LFhippo2]|nr:hypothetical protein [Pasteurellaceae bacterium LFhippo2]